MSYQYKAFLVFDDEESSRKEILTNDVQFSDGWVVLIYGDGDIEAFRATDLQYVRVVPAEVAKLELA